ncbi:DEAD/DEAH box helicase family protein [Clostridium butyricum]|uniref:DEAD/DEAH box helicase family protein n=1 Tax=Clostridium butyricum TaxID=1492 RepID=UPI00189E5B7C|nr:DEAD/DEAH box helicase family protein [Clostridium butyricum]MDB2151178.1 DEAD/DEAH box helicase family protein [Clostridium butyricum]MDU3584086.1 DEAD/DEAH box helicase family protein [Clostridium butyricum]MDU3595616.1 DEAD/DEAH box helicase family protein [Clostridium butyricum]
MKKLTVNEIIKNEGMILHKNKINLIVAPAGSGKTYYIFNTLLQGEKAIYLCDTSNLRDMILKDEEIKQAVRSTDVNFHEIKWRDVFMLPNCIIMTYAKFFYEKDKPQYADIKTIICDEIHNLYKYKDKFDNEESTHYTEVIDNIMARAKQGAQVVGFTATHERIKREMNGLLPNDDSNVTNVFNGSWNVINLSNRTDIKRLRENFVSAFNDITQINYWFARTNLFKYGKKCLIYTDRVTTAKETEAYLNETFRNINAIALWSTNNKDNPMNKEQFRVRESILTTGIIPEEYNVLIINGAYETGINVLDEDIEIVIINNSSVDTIIQARSRVRKDIELLMYRVPRAVQSDYPVITVPSEYLDRKLTTSEKNELIKLLDLRDSNKRLLGWGNFTKVLLFNQYEVIDGRSYIKKKRERVSEITDKLKVRD